MPVNQPAPARQTCPACGAAKIIRHLPREIERRLDYEDITLPDEPEPPPHRVAILRITYEREYRCAECGYQWWETLVTESQKQV